MNKISYFVALFGVLGIAAWPSAIALGFKADLIDAAVFQSTITGLTGVGIYFYRHYKLRQMLLENLLRDLCFSSKTDDEILEEWKSSMSLLDRGITFKVKPHEGDT